MTTNRTALFAGAGAIGIFILGIVIGVGAAGADDQATTDSAVASAIAAVTPAPTPSPRVVEVIREVEVPSPACSEALDVVFKQDTPIIAFASDVLAAYLDYPDESLQDFGRRVEVLMDGLDVPTDADMDEYDRLLAACRDES